MLAVALLMKAPDQAKTRLRETFRHSTHRLAITMFENTLARVKRDFGNCPIGVVTRSPEIAEIAASFECAVIEETENAGLNGAAQCAAGWSSSAGASSLLLMHCDIPFLDSEELRTVIDAGNSNDVVLVESCDGGTNVLLATPPDCVPFHFGIQSASRHETAAREAGRSVVRLSLPLMSRDLDTPYDLDFRSLSARTGEAITARALRDFPEVAAGDDLPALIADCLERNRLTLHPNDILIVAQKVVSKAEGRLKHLSAYTPTRKANELAAETGIDARKVEAILQESTSVLRTRKFDAGGMIISRHRHGWICANAGIDESNIGADSDGQILLLPEDPDLSARKIGVHLERECGHPVGVIVCDTFGRPWRDGLVNIAIGLHGVPAMIDWKGRTDRYGRGLKGTMPATADEISALAGLLMEKDAGCPVVLLSGYNWHAKPSSSAKDILRNIKDEMFL